MLRSVERQSHFQQLRFPRVQMLMHCDVGTNVRLSPDPLSQLPSSTFYYTTSLRVLCILSGKYGLKLKDLSHAHKCNSNTATSYRCTSDNDSMSQNKASPRRTYCATCRLKEQIPRTPGAHVARAVVQLQRIWLPLRP